MDKTTGRVRFAALWPLLLALWYATAASGATPVAQTSDETSKDFGDYEVHVNAIRTDQLTAEIARAYAIQRSRNQVLLNVTVLRTRPGTPVRSAVEAAIAVLAHNLSGQVKPIKLRRVNEGDAIYYIGEVSIAGNEVLVFDVKATPINETRALDVKFKREFFTD
jgi:hypothetical protein